MVCCPAEAHTQCYISHINTYFSTGCFACNTVLFNYNQQPDVPPPLETPEFRAALRVVKKARAARNKGLTAINKAVRHVAIGFKAQTAPLISSLKAMKREALQTVKLTQGWRDGVQASRRYTAILNNFTKEFEVNTQMLRAWGLWPRMFYRNRPTRILLRKFRVQI
jgi:hypothetical protein